MQETFAGNILLFIESGGPGGAERVLLSLAEEYRLRGYVIHVATLRRGWLSDQLALKDISHTLLPFSASRLDTKLIRALVSFIRVKKITVVHSHLLDSNFYASIACRIAGVQHVATEHGDVHHTKRKSFARIKMFLAFLLGTRFTAVSEFTAKHLVRHGVPRFRITVIGNPIQLPKIDYRPERAATRARMNIPESAPPHWVWIHVANFRKVKDQATLLKGFALALSQSPIPQTLAIVGDGPEKGELHALGQELGIQGALRWLGFRDDVGLYLAAADGFILSSKSEALPMSLLEAALSGLVLVSSRVGGVPEIVREGITGSLFSPESPQELAQVLGRILANQEAARDQAIQAQILVKENFLLDKIVTRYLARYRP